MRDFVFLSGPIKCLDKESNVQGPAVVRLRWKHNVHWFYSTHTMEFQWPWYVLYSRWYCGILMYLLSAGLFQPRLKVVLVDAVHITEELNGVQWKKYHGEVASTLERFHIMMHWFLRQFPLFLYVMFGLWNMLQLEGNCCKIRKQSIHWSIEEDSCLGDMVISGHFVAECLELNWQSVQDSIYTFHYLICT